MLAFILILVVISALSIALASGLHKMNNQYPDYKGEDFLDWDDDKIHTEDKF
jgi:hypothetical protein